MKEFFKKFWNEEDGIGIVEILLILAVIVGLAIIFRTEITAMVNKIFTNNNKKVDEFFK